MNILGRILCHWSHHKRWSRLVCRPDTRQWFMRVSCSRCGAILAEDEWNVVGLMQNYREGVTFPIMAEKPDRPSGRYKVRDFARDFLIPWEVALVAWREYDRRYHGQTLERIAQRGGFYESEMDDFYPEWRTRIAAEGYAGNEQGSPTQG